MRTLLPDNDPNDWVQFLKPKPCYFESISLTNKVTSKQMQMWLLWSKFARYFPLFAVLHSAVHTAELQWPINCFFIGTLSHGYGERVHIPEFHHFSDNYMNLHFIMKKRCILKTCLFLWYLFFEKLYVQKLIKFHATNIFLVLTFPF